MLGVNPPVNRRGISPVIATVIIVAVAIAIAIAVASWLYSIYSGYGGYEALRILPSSYADAAKDEVVLYLRNEGTKAASIIAVEVNGVSINVNAIVNPGEQRQITVAIPKDQNGNPLIDVKAGDAYNVRVITKEGVYVSVIYGR